MNTETQAEALRLANALEDGTYLLSVERDATAAEMRRLHIVEQAFQQWITKTEWVQKSAQSHELGMHRADVMKQRIDQLLTENQQLRADLEAIGAGGVGPLIAAPQPPVAEQPQGEQEPVAEVIESHVRAGLNGQFTAVVAGRERLSVGAELFVHPHPRQPLTEMEIVELRQLTPGTLDVQFVKFARSIERAHEIGGKA